MPRGKDEQSDIVFGDLPLGNMVVGKIIEKGRDVKNYNEGEKGFVSFLLTGSIASTTSEPENSFAIKSRVWINCQKPKKSGVFDASKLTNH